MVWFQNIFILDLVCFWFKWATTTLTIKIKTTEAAAKSKQFTIDIIYTSQVNAMYMLHVFMTVKQIQWLKQSPIAKTEIESESTIYSCRTLTLTHLLQTLQKKSFNSYGVRDVCVCGTLNGHHSHEWILIRIYFHCTSMHTSATFGIQFCSMYEIPLRLHHCTWTFLSSWCTINCCCCCCWPIYFFH